MMNDLPFLACHMSHRFILQRQCTQREHLFFSKIGLQIGKLCFQNIFIHKIFTLCFDRQKSTDDFLIKLNSVAIFFSCLNHCSRYDVKDNEFNMFFLKDIYKKSTHIGQHPTRRTWVTAELFAVWHTIQCKEGVLLFDLYKALLKLLWTCFLDQTVTSL